MTFGIELRVYYQDTDAGGVVYHATYLDYMERARTELLNSLGIDLAAVAERRRVQFMVHQLAVKYHLPARLNERLTVTAEVAKMGRASMVFRQAVAREGALLVEADITVALVDRDRMKPARMPQELEQAFR